MITFRKIILAEVTMIVIQQGKGSWVIWKEVFTSFKWKILLAWIQNNHTWDWKKWMNTDLLKREETKSKWLKLKSNDNTKTKIHYSVVVISHVTVLLNSFLYFKSQDWRRIIFLYLISIYKLESWKVNW